MVRVSRKVPERPSEFDHSPEYSPAARVVGAAGGWAALLVGGGETDGELHPARRIQHVPIIKGKRFTHKTLPGRPGGVKPDWNPGRVSFNPGITPRGDYCPQVIALSPGHFHGGATRH